MQNSHAGSKAPRGLRLRDILRADIPAIYRALSRDPMRRDRMVRRLHRFANWLERGGEYEVRTHIVTPLPLLWAWSDGDGSPAARIHRHFLRALWRSRTSLGRIVLVLSLLLWLPIVFGLALWSSWLNAGTVRRDHRIGVLRQFAQQIWFAGRHGLLPPWYYMYELFDPAQQAKAAHFIHRYELKGGLLQMLRLKVKAARRSPTQNKVAFIARCRKAKIPVLRNIAIFRKGELMLRSIRREDLLSRDLFVKPTRGRGGEGAGLWLRTPEGYHLHGGPVISPEELLVQLAALSQSRTLLIQNRGRNHEGLADLSNGALCTARIVTMRNENGGFEAVCALFRMAVGDNRQVDNFHAGGIAAPIDVATGRLGRATDWGLRPRHGWRTHHPDTGGLIDGRVLPLWAETRALAERAHQTFDDRHLIGWDMAILSDGPAIVEANGGPDTDMHQRVSRDPLGSQRFGQLMAFHLGKL